MKIWKVEVRYHGSIAKKKFYEREEDFKKWFPIHQKNYQPPHPLSANYEVKGFVTEIDWEEV